MDRLWRMCNHAFFHQCQAEMLMVHPDFRGRRIGEHLLKALEAKYNTPKFGYPCWCNAVLFRRK